MTFEVPKKLSEFDIESLIRDANHFLLNDGTEINGYLVDSTSVKDENIPDLLFRQGREYFVCGDDIHPTMIAPTGGIFWRKFGMTCVDRELFSLFPDGNMGLLNKQEGQ